MRVLLTSLKVVSLSAVCQCLVAQEIALPEGPGSQPTATASFLPAELSFAGAETLADAIKFPDTEGDVTVTLYCALHAQSSDIFSNFCVTPDSGTSAFEEAFRAVMPRLRVSTARQDGRRKPVWIPYSVEFTKRGDDERVQIYENYGLESARYGKEYSGPQRILSSSERERVADTCRASQPGSIVWVRTNVTADGKPNGIRVMTDTSEACRDSIEAFLADSSYIPAHYQGEPVAAELLEPFFPALHLNGSCNARTHDTQRQLPPNGLHREPQRSRCYWDGLTWHRTS